MERTAEQDRSGAERILDAAIEMFGAHGFRATPLKLIAERAGVSQALIVHHYGSKAGLRVACDEHVAAQVRTRKEETVEAEPQFDPFGTLRRLQAGRPLLRYLTRALTESGDHTAELVDDIVADAEQYLRHGEEAGIILPSAAPRDRAALLVIWSLGALTMHEHLKRLLGADFLAGSAEPEDLQRYLRPAIELYMQGLVTEGSFTQLAAAMGLSVPDDRFHEHEHEHAHQHDPAHQHETEHEHETEKDQ